MIENLNIPKIYTFYFDYIDYFLNNWNLNYRYIPNKFSFSALKDEENLIIDLIKIKILEHSWEEVLYINILFNYNWY